MRALSLLIKPASGNCQLRCRYCFYENVTLSRQIANYGLMSPETQEILVRNAIAETDEQCSFSFQGGEPTLIGLPFYRRLIELQQHYKTEYKKDGLVINNVIQTNGLLLDDEWCDFFRSNHFLVGLSLDGDKDIHDANRQDAQGKGTYNRVLKAARLLDRQGVDFNILCVVTRELARRGKHVYRELVKQGFRYLQFIPCIDDFGAEPGSSPHALTADRFGQFLKDVFDEWHQDFLSGRYISVRHFDNWVHMLQGRPPETCSMAGRCTCYGVIEADGSVYPCDFYVLDPWKLGSIREHSFAELLSGELARHFVDDSVPTNEKCQSCEHYSLCRDGCRRDREPLDPVNGALNAYCCAYEQFFSYAADRLRQIARIAR
jgi:uncharacterized protein